MKLLSDRLGKEGMCGQCAELLAFRTGDKSDKQEAEVSTQNRHLLTAGAREAKHSAGHVVSETIITARCRAGNGGTL